MSLKRFTGGLAEPDPDSEEGTRLARLRAGNEQAALRDRPRRAEAHAAGSIVMVSGEYDALLAHDTQFASTVENLLQRLDEAYCQVGRTSMAGPAEASEAAAEAQATLAAVSRELEEVDVEGRSLPHHLYCLELFEIGVLAEKMVNLVRSGSWEALELVRQFRSGIQAARGRDGAANLAVEFDEVVVADGGKHKVRLARLVNGIEADSAEIRGRSLVRLFKLVAERSPTYIRWEEMCEIWVREPGWKGLVPTTGSLKDYGRRINRTLMDKGFTKYWRYSADEVAWRPPSN